MAMPSEPISGPGVRRPTFIPVTALTPAVYAIHPLVPQFALCTMKGERRKETGPDQVSHGWSSRHL